MPQTKRQWLIMDGEHLPLICKTFDFYQWPKPKRFFSVRTAGMSHPSGWGNALPAINGTPLPRKLSKKNLLLAMIGGMMNEKEPISREHSPKLNPERK
jgi:hypothetical protein